VLSKPEPTYSFAIAHYGSKRNLAYSDVGDKHCDEILICIPGLLETRDTFSPLLEKIQKQSHCRAVSVDLCGRGDSQPLSSSDVYSMKLYLSDLELFLAHIKETHLCKPVKINLLGTSMGGILAMYLAASAHNNIASVILNDVGFSLAWWSIYKLYGTMSKGSMKTANSMDVNYFANELGVSSDVIRAVQDPAHFDLPYKSDLMGMRFAHTVYEFKGPISLIHAQDSVICTAIQVDEFLKLYPTSNLLEVPGAGHPAPYNDLVCKFVISKINKTSLKEDAATPPKVDTPKASHTSEQAKPENSKSPVQPEQLTLFNSLALYPVEASQAAQKLVELNTQILDQLSASPQISENAKAVVDQVFTQQSNVGMEPFPPLNTVAPAQKLSQSILNRWKSAVSDLFKPK